MGRKSHARAVLSRGSLRSLTLVASLALASCAGATSGGLNTTSQHLGRGTEQAILDIVPITLHRYGYSVSNSRRTPSAIYFETAWAQRLPFEDEAGAGAEAIRTRITVEARRAGKLYSVWLRVENAALGSTDGSEWHTVAASKTFEQHLARITTAIRDEIDSGIRVY